MIKLIQKIPKILFGSFSLSGKGVDRNCLIPPKTFWVCLLILFPTFVKSSPVFSERLYLKDGWSQNFDAFSKKPFSSQSSVWNPCPQISGDGKELVSSIPFPFKITNYYPAYQAEYESDDEVENFHDLFYEIRTDLEFIIGYLLGLWCYCRWYDGDFKIKSIFRWPLTIWKKIQKYRQNQKAKNTGQNPPAGF